jgi:hypothetical protein
LGRPAFKPPTQCRTARSSWGDPRLSIARDGLKSRRSRCARRRLRTNVPGHRSRSRRTRISRRE